jgi:hypothetical protein
MSGPERCSSLVSQLSRAETMLAHAGHKDALVAPCVLELWWQVSLRPRPSECFWREG